MQSARPVTYFAIFLLFGLVSPVLAEIGEYKITTKANPSLCLESNAPVNGASLGGASFLRQCLNETGQFLRFERMIDGYYTITNISGNGRCLESNKPGFVQEVDSATFMDDCDNVTGQDWRLDRIGDNEYTLTSRFAAPEGRCLEGEMDEIDAGNPAAGAAGMDLCDGSDDQVWTFNLAGNSATADTDGDGILDQEELSSGQDPFDPGFPSYTSQVYYFNPASNTGQASTIRLSNPGAANAQVTIEGIDDTGTSGNSLITVDVEAFQTVDLTAIELENGGGSHSGSLGNGSGKWRLAVTSNRPVEVMSLLSTPEGKFTNAISTVPVVDGVHQILVGNGNFDTFRESFLRFINLADTAGEVSLTPFSQQGAEGPTVTMSLAARASQNIQVNEIEIGAPQKNLEGSIGQSSGEWRIEATPDDNVSLKVMSMMRTTDGFVTDLGFSASATAHPLTGVWRGTYTCNQGLTRLVLNIDASDPANLVVLFNFSEHQDNPGVPSGSFAMTGIYNATLRTVDLNAGEWLKRPGSYVTVDLDGSLSAQGERISGTVSSASCTEFLVFKD